MLGGWKKGKGEAVPVAVAENEEEVPF